ncbi:ABC transporter permease [Patescibacteria group bacterium]|nr:ABC transporter permease [Patescibacteria group bacterium]
MSFWQLFLTNLRMMYRNWRGLFFNIVLPVALYIAIGKISNAAPGFAGISYSQYLLPGIIAMTIMQTGIFNLAYWLVDIKSRGVIKRFLVTPLSSFQLVTSLILSRLVLMAVQVGLLIFIGTAYLHADFNGSIIAVAIMLALGGITFLTLGFLVSSFAKTYEEAAPITTILNLVFTILGNIFFPTKGLPAVFRIIGGKLPITYLAEGMRNNFIGHATLKQSLGDILGLVVWSAIFLAITAKTFKLKED